MRVNTPNTIITGFAQAEAFRHNHTKKMILEGLLENGGQVTIGKVRYWSELKYPQKSGFVEQKPNSTVKPVRFIHGQLIS